MNNNDESHTACAAMAIGGCNRYNYNNSETILPVTIKWICDGVEDCTGVID